MAYINPRLRNPAEGAAATKATAPAKTDWIGGVCAIIAFGLAAATTAILYMEWDLYTNFIGR
ncbi:MAG: hypothetical protein IKW23_01595 [Kiritimatiellae bacterium]|jgi:hypothetical protein|nr:hypothetical protein [Kiritimatiellia bacterium]MBR4945574.1 hypothetical protein [Kiritimatiellia bacterium]MBR5587528.1 hypothetical protein [Kiritimatiellia bacterium]